MVPVNLTIPSVGVVSLAKFAELSGIDEGICLGWVKKGYLPTKKIGKYTLINLVAFHQELNNSDSVEFDTSDN